MMSKLQLDLIQKELSTKLEVSKYNIKLVMILTEKDAHACNVNMSYIGT